MSESMVQVRSVTKVYERGKQKIEVLHRLTLDIPKGDFVALMGPSGSGKTTLLNLIGGLDKPTSGEIVVGGSRIDQLSSGQLAHWRAHNVGFVFQFYNLMPVLSAEGNVELPTTCRATATFFLRCAEESLVRSSGSSTFCIAVSIGIRL